jgi:hypothetical protein
MKREVDCKGLTESSRNPVIEFVVAQLFLSEESFGRVTKSLTMTRHMM